jgi:hypothetical protein
VDAGWTPFGEDEEQIGDAPAAVDRRTVVFSPVADEQAAWGGAVGAMYGPVGDSEPTAFTRGLDIAAGGSAGYIVAISAIVLGLL